MTTKHHISVDQTNSIESDIETTKTRIGEAATALQDAAADPAHNVWVGASAGTGKTKVLTERVLRLLLPTPGRDTGTPPEKILCITFTKAGASEMIARIMKTLSVWSVCDADQLDQKLTALLGQPPSLKQMDKARHLFAEIVDLPEGLKITTIHAFCQSVLGRFPLEAGLSPHFTVIEDGEAASLIRQARNDLIAAIRNKTASPALSEAFSRLAKWKNGEQINELIRAILSDRIKIKRLDTRMNNRRIEKAVCDILSITPDDTRETVIAAFFSKDRLPQNKLLQLVTALDHGSPTNKTKGASIKAFLARPLDEKINLYNSYARLFLKSDGDLYAAKEIGKDAQAHDPQAIDIFFDEARRIQICNNTLKSLAIKDSTLTLLIVAGDIIDRYETLKARQNALDYDDLILRTRDLLISQTQGGHPMVDWVLYKLDGGIDHILVDEAQDTNPAQWEILLKLSEEFFAGIGTRDDIPTRRTLFVVGDEKQSIFRFQGAEPQSFDHVRSVLKSRIESAQAAFVDVPMNTSFRSVSAILDLVDAIFNQDELKGMITRNPATSVKHAAYRQGQAGRIDIWPVYRTPKSETREPWQMPIEIRQGYNAQAALAERIAETVAGWIGRETLPAQNRTMTAGDVMILVRRRNALVDHLIRALKTRNIPVSGVDRMVVSDQIAVQDILAALSFSMMPEDDLTLATLLRSPFVGMDDRTLEDMAYTRTGSLWTAIRERGASDITQWLHHLIDHVSILPVFDAINTLLITACPHRGETGWQALISRLGNEAIDPIEELLNVAQNYDIRHAASGIQGFLNLMQSDKRELKREMDSGEGMVRIMTVHASKGLQAPVVILPDTCAMPSPPAQSKNGFVWTDDGIPLWINNADDVNDVYAALRDNIKAEDYAEYCRLLYVALTRAEDRLVICGYLPQNRKDPAKGCWYDLIARGFDAVSDDLKTRAVWEYDISYCLDGAQSHSYETPQLARPKSSKKTDMHYPDAPPLPSWAGQTITQEQHPPKTLMPSRMDDEDVPVRSPLTGTDDNYRFRRGLLTHSLLQYLPELSPDQREDSAVQFLDRQAPDLPETTRESILSESLSILSDPRFARFFAAGSLAEVPVTGVVSNPITGKKDIISGQIDRLVIGDRDIWIVDYKSNRPPPADIKNIPTAYRNQMQAYRILMQEIYPAHTIHTALLWTDGPSIMIINPDDKT